MLAEARDIMPGLPGSVVREDQQLEAAAEKASEALAELRWHWTLDESNPDRVGIREYARQVGTGKSVIHRYAHGFVLFKQGVPGTGDTILEAITRAGMSAEKQVIIEAVAETNRTTFHDARRHHKEEVYEVKHAVERENERREEQGKNFDAEERADYAKRVAAQKKAARDAEERHRQEQRKKHNAMFLEVDARLSKARRELKEALDAIRDVEFSEEEVALLERQNEAVQGMSRLVGSALTGDSGTDWDAELAQLEEKRQYG